MLFTMIDKFELNFEQDEVAHPALTLLGAGALVMFCYDRTLPIAQSSASLTGHLIAICTSIVLIGMVMLISRKTAISQVAGFMTIENGLFFAAVSITKGMPMIVEFGVAFDVLVAAVIFGVFFLHIKESIESLDIGSMAELTEKDS
jgi:hydrogenase-4 component E